METPLKVRLHILSPVHIGCDDAYEPTSFVIDEKKGRLIEFDPMAFIKSMSQQDRQRFSEICMQGNISSIVSVYKFISGRQVDGREVEIANGIPAQYKRVRDLPLRDEKKLRQELNQFAISRTAYSPYSNLPYIPGSSFKGALRTAYLSKLAEDRGIKGRKDGAKEVETVLLGGSFDKDPFRMVKVSDLLPVTDVRTRIVYAVNKKKRSSSYEARGPFQILETIKPGTVLEGVINISTPGSGSGIGRPISSTVLVRSASAFYGKVLEDEKSVLKGICASHIEAGQFNGKLGKSAFLVRLGRHSGAEAVTIEGNRHIKIMQAKGERPRFFDHATTIWLAAEVSKPTTNSGLVPFGWAVLELLPFDVENIYPSIKRHENKDKVPVEADTEKTNSYAVPEKPSHQPIIWENAPLTWDPSRKVVKTEIAGKKAETEPEEGRLLVPEPLHEKLFERRKTVKANVTVEHIGGKAFRIVKIE